MTHQIRMKVYIAGPMTGLPDNNYPAFHKAADDLAKQGLVPLNPANNKGTYWIDFMRGSLRMIADADALYMLKDWEKSEGARLEHQLALGLHLPIFYELPQEAGDILKQYTKQVAPGVKEGWTGTAGEAKLAERVVQAAYAGTVSHGRPLLKVIDTPSTGKDIPKAKEQFVVLALDVFDKWAPIKYFDDYAKAEAFKDRLRALVPGLPVDLQPVKNPV